MLKFNLIKYKNNISDIIKYHIVDDNNSLCKYKCNNLYAPFNKEINKFEGCNQHRLNIKYDYKLVDIITNIEDFFSKFKNFNDYNLNQIFLIIKMVSL